MNNLSKFYPVMYNITVPLNVNNLAQQKQSSRGVLLEKVLLEISQKFIMCFEKFRFQNLWDLPYYHIQFTV